MLRSGCAEDDPGESVDVADLVRGADLSPLTPLPAAGLCPKIHLEVRCSLFSIPGSLFPVPRLIEFAGVLTRRVNWRTENREPETENREFSGKAPRREGGIIQNTLRRVL